MFGIKITNKYTSKSYLYPKTFNNIIDCTESMEKIPQFRSIHNIVTPIQLYNC